MLLTDPDHVPHHTAHINVDPDHTLYIAHTNTDPDHTLSAGKIGGTKLWRMSQSGCSSECNLAVQHLQVTIPMVYLPDPMTGPQSMGVIMHHHCKHMWRSQPQRWRSFSLEAMV